MKMYKLLVAILSFALICGLLGACGTTPPAPTEPADATDAPAVETDGGTGEATQPEGYPEQTITWIVPAAAGAAIDLPTRALIEQLDLGDGAKVVVENIDGASQTIGTAEAKNRDADGYTLLTAANGGMLLQPSLVDLTYDTFEDFRHIAMIASPDPFAVAVSEDSGLQSFDELLEKLESGERLTWSAANPGSIGQLALLAAFDQLGITSAEFVPFNGSPEVITALLGGHIDFMVMDAAVVSQRVEQGQVRALVSLSSSPIESLPDVPCIEDYGVTDADLFQGYKWLAVRSDTPDDIVEWIKLKVNEATQSEEYQQYLIDNHFGKLEVYTEEEITEIARESYEVCGEMLTELGMHK